MALIIGSIIVGAMTIYHDNVTMVDYIISDDYTSVVYKYDKEKAFLPINELPSSIDEEFGALPEKARLENDKSKEASCYRYEYNGLIYLKVVVRNNKFILTGDDQKEDVFYYVESTQ
ncbi:MAG: hypothetical protein K2F65_05890 [Eubacterium sp.]|nr:hypothetical protein [Eubacterium sp.]